MNQDQILSLVRTLLKTVGAAAAAKGWGDSSNWEMIAGAVATVIGMFWSHWTHAQGPTDNVNLAGKVGAWLMGIGVALMLVSGCASVAPGSDPLVVHVEQVQTIAHATFDTFLSIDNANRAFFKTNAPAMHEFAEYLRTKVEVNGTNLYPRYDAFLLSLDKTKLAYKAGYTNSSGLMKALAAVQTAVSESQQYISETATNH